MNRIRKFFFRVFCGLMLLFNPVMAQERDARTDSLLQMDMPDIVVTATKSARELQNVPIPTRIVTLEEVKNQGARRLSDLLGELNGLTLVEEFGTGIQMQGLDAAYTLILIDGEPVIGREGGTLDLERLSVADIERVEIVRGPLSSLYGSEALAGVINIVTREPENGIGAALGLQYETHETMDLSSTFNVKHNQLGGRFSFNRYSSAGYDLFPDLLGLTVPGFVDYAGTARLTFEPGDRTEWHLNARLARQDQQSTTGLLLNGILVEFDEKAVRTDWSLAPRFTHLLAPGLKLTGRFNFAEFSTQSELQDRLNPENAQGEAWFDQGFYKAEAQLDAVMGMRHVLSFGSGYIREAVEANRVRGGLRSFYNGYGYLQHEWIPGSLINLVTSARLDVHSDYGARLSPNIALLVKPQDNIRLRASVGSGFKAPTFQQLYMDFTNPAAGYSVLGSVDIQEAVTELENNGQIQYYLTDPSTIQATGPETAIAFNLGLETSLGDATQVELNLFRNNVTDMIETLPVAVKTNGQSVFSYVNLSEIYTQGLNAEVKLQPGDAWSLAVGYQFLDAKDRNVNDEVAAGRVFRRVNGRDQRVQPADYGGLFNRSRHSGTVRFSYTYPSAGLTASIRGIYRGQYGFGDRNGNLILDDESEYVSGYMVWNATVTKVLGSSIELQTGVRNALAEKNPEFIPSLSGRLLFVGLRYTLKP